MGDISGSLSLGEILERLMESVMDILGAENCSLYLVDDQRERLSLAMSRGPLGSTIPRDKLLARGEKVPGRAWSEGRSLLLSPEDIGRGELASPEVARKDVVSMLAVPLIHRGRILGVAKITNRRDGRPFDAEDVEVFEFVCGQAASAIHLSFLHESELRHQRMRLEMDRASEVQRMLLPGERPEPPGLDVATHSRPCEAIGGDYLDLFPPPCGPETAYCLALGDISGHGTASALLMTTLRAYVRANAHLSCEPHRLLGEVNRLFTSDTYRGGHFCTLSFLTLDTAEGCMRWASAGHPYGLVFDPGEGSFHELSGSDPPIGCCTDKDFQGFNTCGLPPGAVVILCSDGLWEARDTAGEMFGIERVKAEVRAHAGKRAQDIVQAVLSSLEEFTEDRALEDDVTLAVFRRTSE